MQSFNLFFFLGVLISLTMPTIRAKAQSENSGNVELTIKQGIDKLEKHCLHFNISAPTAVRDSLDNVIGFKEVVLIEDTNIITMILNQEPFFLKKVLLKLLRDENETYAWAANLFLFYINQTDANAILKYAPDNCHDWYVKQHNGALEYWSSH